MTKPHSVAVIGSGFGGLAAAIRLQSAGVPTTIFERRDKPGGRAYAFSADGFTFDCGPTVITAPEAIAELFALSGRKMSDYVDLRPVTPFYRLYWDDGTTFNFTGDISEMKAEIAKIAPTDVDGYERFLAYAEQVYKTGYEGLVDVPFLHLWDMVKVSPELIRLKGYRSVYGQISTFFKHEKVRQAFSFNSLLIGGNPFRASAIYTLIHPLERLGGVHFPVGGTHALVLALVKLFEDLGGTLLLNQLVNRIVCKDGTVVGVEANGVIHEFGEVISNADVVTTYQGLLADQMPAQKTTRRLLKNKHSMSLFVLYLGLDRTYDSLAHHNIFFGKRYRELIRDIFDRGVLSDDFSIYLHTPPNALGPFAPAGGQALYALIPVPHLGKAPIDWNLRQTAFAEQIINRLEDFMPELSRHVVTQHMFTPKDFETVLGSHLGSAFSLEPTLTQSAWFRVKNADRKIPGLYFVGAGTHPGAGIPGVINSGKATADLLLADRGQNRNHMN